MEKYLIAIIVGGIVGGLLIDWAWGWNSDSSDFGNGMGMGAFLGVFIVFFIDIISATNAIS